MAIDNQTIWIETKILTYKKLLSIIESIKKSFSLYMANLKLYYHIVAKNSFPGVFKNSFVSLK